MTDAQAIPRHNGERATQGHAAEAGATPREPHTAAMNAVILRSNAAARAATIGIELANGEWADARPLILELASKAEREAYETHDFALDALLAPETLA